MRSAQLLCRVPATQRVSLAQLGQETTTTTHAVSSCQMLSLRYDNIAQRRDPAANANRCEMTKRW